MTKLVLRLLFLLGPFAALMVVFEFKFQGVNNNQYTAKKRLLESSANEVEILTLGSSHSYYGIKPEFLGQRAFNLAATSQSIYYDVELAIKYIPNLPRLTTIILPVSYHTLENQLDQGPERWRCYYYYRFYSIAHQIRSMAYDIRNFSLYWLYGNNRSELIYHDASRDFDKYGGLLESTPLRTAKELQNGAVVALKRHHAMMSPDNITANIAALEKLVGELQRRKIRLILVTIPVTPYYREGVQAATYARMQRALDRFCRQNGVAYRSYFSDGRFTLDDFFDADHLNHDGAVKFSEYLRKEALR
jgi:hypothetical protein